MTKKTAPNTNEDKEIKTITGSSEQILP